jgi:hypothetical protein
VLCHAPKKDYLRRLLQEPLPIESHLDHALAEHLNAEVVTKTVESKQVGTITVSLIHMLYWNAGIDVIIVLLMKLTPPLCSQCNTNMSALATHTLVDIHSGRC